jgi:hypothetical protein
MGVLFTKFKMDHFWGIGSSCGNDDLQVAASWQPSACLPAVLLGGFTHSLPARRALPFDGLGVSAC